MARPKKAAPGLVHRKRQDGEMQFNVNALQCISIFDYTAGAKRKQGEFVGQSY